MDCVLYLKRSWPSTQIIILRSHGKAITAIVVIVKLLRVHVKGLIGEIKGGGGGGERRRIRGWFDWVAHSEQVLDRLNMIANRERERDPVTIVEI